ncbi:class III lanthionine synthetase LanKC [Sphaerimonospora sp. CA-214678]|uniref:class III lanthionine synthetase LanKC n=1 Tax=Sphaerimonospora sp. CA-214678 TaxID=3240029 RepID=UPI003D8B8360
MEKRYELYCRTDPVFYDSPALRPPGETTRPLSDGTPPEGLPYRIEAVLREGGVYLAVDPETGERVVLKEAAGRDREAEALVRLAGLGVAPEPKGRIHAGGRWFLVLEHVPGEPLDVALAVRNPLTGAGTDGLGGHAEGRLEGYAEWVKDVCAKVEDAVMKVHARGLVHGGLDPANILIRPDGGVTLVGFGAARPIAEPDEDAAADSAITPPGTVSPKVGGLDADRYALACLRLALFLPLTELFALDRGKPAELAAVIRGLFPVQESFLRPAVRIAGCGASPRTPYVAEAGWRRMRESMTRAILASATPGRDDRLFPGDVAQFDGGGRGLGLAHGAAGVLYALHATGAGRFPEHEQWLIDRARRYGTRVAPGFYDGLHGVAHALGHLGRHEEALEVLDIAGATCPRSLGIDLYGGLSGIALNQAYLGDLDAALRTAALVADRLAGEELDGRPGLMYGSTGPALLFVRMFERTGDVEWLTQAERALRRDLRRRVSRADGSLWIAGRGGEGDLRPTPHLDRGSVGVSWVLEEFLHYRPDPELAAVRGRLDRAARAHLHREAGLFAGRAGIIAYLCRDRAGGWGREDEETGRQLAALSWHAIDFRGHLAFPGERLLRLSMDLATGTAGVLLAVGAALHDEPVGLPFLGGTPPARLRSRPPAGLRAVAVSEGHR